MADFVEFRLAGIDGVLDTLKSLPAEIVSKRGGPVKTALRKGAQVLLKAAKANLRKSTSNATVEGSQSTGFLLKHLVATRGKAPSSGKGERYLVRVKRAAYVRGANTSTKLKRREKVGKRVTTLQTANLLEYGSANQPAEPWLRPAFNEKAREAINTVERELVVEVAKVVAKLAAKNRMR